jgi:flagellar basal body-associated protein FliL
MGIIQELADVIGKLKFFEVVHEYQQGLYFRKGRVMERPVRLDKNEKKKLRAEEKKLVSDVGGYRSFILPFRPPKLPPKYKRSFITGLPLHPKRFEKSRVLRPGIYFFIPLVDSIVTDSRQQKVLNLGNISVPTIDADSKTVLVSCNIRYELMNLYLAYTAVHDYETSLKDHTLSILAKNSRGKRYEDWKDPQVIDKLEKNVMRELKTIVTEKWGLKIHRVYITDHVAGSTQRILHEGHPLFVPTAGELDRTSSL